MVVLVALAMPVLVGAMGLAAETSYWYVHKRGMQNAADAAAIAAATNGVPTMRPRLRRLLRNTDFRMAPATSRSQRLILVPPLAAPLTAISS